MKSIEESLN